MLRYVRHLIAHRLSWCITYFFRLPAGAKSTSYSRLFSQGFTILPYPLRFTEVLTESASVSYAAIANSSSTMNWSALLKMYSASAKIASVLSSAFDFLNCFNGQLYPLHVEYQLLYNRNQYAPICYILTHIFSLSTTNHI